MIKRAFLDLLYFHRSQIVDSLREHEAVTALDGSGTPEANREIGKHYERGAQLKMRLQYIEALIDMYWTEHQQ